MQNITSVLRTSATQAAPFAPVIAIFTALALLSGCATHQQGVASPNAPQAEVLADLQSPTPTHEKLSSRMSNTEMMSRIRKASNLGILFHTLEVPAFTHGEGVPSPLVESLRETIMERIRHEQLFDRVVASSPNHENTLILNARVISWDEEAIEVNLTVDTRCGCRLGEALGKGTTQVTKVHSGETANVSYDLLPVAQGAVQYIAGVMGAKHG